MKKNIAWFALCFLAALLLLVVNYASSQSTQQVLLSLISPTSCPSSGCAAGQRMNFQIDFDVVPLYNSGPNTLLCISSPSDGQSGTGSEPWANYDTGWISQSGLISGIVYTEGDHQGICSATLPQEETLITSVYAQVLNNMVDRLEFTLRINNLTDIDGNIKIYLLQATANGSEWLPPETSQLSIRVSPTNNLVYVANAAADCSNFSPCYINSADDLPSGLGTGLKDAVDASENNAEIVIISDYRIKSQTVLINKAHYLIGSQNSSINYDNADCSNPMLRFTGGGSISQLIISDGNCTSPSRNLVEVDSPADFHISNNTIENGLNGIVINKNSGNISIDFNQIRHNDMLGIKVEGEPSSGTLLAVANNIFENQAGLQAHCLGQGIVDHNFWGAGISVLDAVQDCTAEPGKQLGAEILDANPGVQAFRDTVSTQNSSAFEGQISYRHTNGSDYDIFLVNHGIGSPENVPFGTGNLTACSPYFDVFLAPGANADDLQLSVKYDLYAGCIAQIESDAYCGQPDSSLYPLWWFDPAYDVTELWDRTGQDPEGPGGVGQSGQDTWCDTDNKEIAVSIDASGRPDLVQDMNFTPLVVGLSLPDGIILENFSAEYIPNQINITWRTASEVNISGFILMKSLTEFGTYTPISELIMGRGTAFSGDDYAFQDDQVEAGNNYYYKLQVLNTNGEQLELYGPVFVFIPQPSPTKTNTWTETSTPTATQTNTPTKTNTPSITQTQTPTPTASRTRTKTPTPTASRTITRTATITRTGTKTPTRTFTHISYITNTRTNTPTAYKSPTSSYKSPTPTRTKTPIYSQTTTLTSSTMTTQTQTEQPLTKVSLTTNPYPATKQPTESIENSIATSRYTEDIRSDKTSTTTLSESENGNSNSVVLAKSDRFLHPLWIPFMLGGTIGFIALALIGWILFKVKHP